MESTKPKKDALLAKLIEITETNLSNELFGVSELAREMGMSRSNLHRKVKSITNITISQFIRRIRLTRALELLRESSMTVTEVAIMSGFGSLTYFTKCFNDYYGVPPSKFNRIEVTESYIFTIENLQSKKETYKITANHIWITIVLITLVSAVILILLLNPAISKPVVNQKTIAVLPFSYHNPDSGNAFLLNGLMNEIRYKLSLVEDLAVTPRTSVERYRNSSKSNIEIGNELNVNYVLECSAQIIQGKTRVSLQLIVVINNKNIWSEPFEREISINNILEVQKDVALAVSNNLKPQLEIKDKEQIEKIPTENHAAYNLFLIGKNFMHIRAYSPDRKTRDKALISAKQSFEKALKLDSTLTHAYAALGLIYIDKLYPAQLKMDLYDEAGICLDSGLLMLDKALLYDSENQEALKCKAAYFDRIGLHQDANRIYERLLKHMEPTYEFYQDEVRRFYYIKDYYGVIENYKKYLE